MTRMITAAALAAVLAGQAAAQVAGTYSGTSADGNNVSFTVATDPNTGVLALTSASISTSALCSDGSTLNTGIGFGFYPLADIKHQKVTSNGGGPIFTTDLTLTFSADGQTATGTIYTATPTLSPVGPHPKKALFCSSATQPMGVTLQSGDARGTPPAGQIIYSKGGVR